jgi:hypothetical protein
MRKSNTSTPVIISLCHCTYTKITNHKSALKQLTLSRHFGFRNVKSDLCFDVERFSNRKTNYEIRA